jgi:hypothetical protein
MWVANLLLDAGYSEIYPLKGEGAIATGRIHDYDIWVTAVAKKEGRAFRARLHQWNRSEPEACRHVEEIERVESVDDDTFRAVVREVGARRLDTPAFVRRRLRLAASAATEAHRLATNMHSTGAGTQSKVPLLISIIGTITAIIAASIAFQEARFAQNQLALAEKKFQEVELPSVLSVLQAQIGLELDFRHLPPSHSLDKGRFILSLQNRSNDEVSDMAISLRLLLQDRQTGDFEEREIASDIQTVIYPSPIKRRIDLTLLARSNVQQYRDNLLSTHIAHAVIVNAEWRVGSGRRVSLVRGYSLLEGTK